MERTNQPKVQSECGSGTQPAETRRNTSPPTAPPANDFECGVNMSHSNELLHVPMRTFGWAIGLFAGLLVAAVGTPGPRLQAQDKPAEAAASSDAADVETAKQEADETDVPSTTASAKNGREKKSEEKLPPPVAPEAAAGAGAKLVRLSPTDEVWIDAKKKRVIVGGTICLREGVLEMFACPKGTKEHESVVAVNAKAYQIHTALLAIGARAGHPVRYEPQYESASGSVVHIEVIWQNEAGKIVRRNGQSMVRDVKTGKTMSIDWVFAGSGFWEDTETGEKYYQAEGGELICVSNFSTAMVDLPVESSRDNASLLYEANTDEIPPRGTPVRLVFTIGGFREK